MRRRGLGAGGVLGRYDGMGWDGPGTGGYRAGKVYRGSFDGRWSEPSVITGALGRAEMKKRVRKQRGRKLCTERMCARACEREKARSMALVSLARRERWGGLRNKWLFILQDVSDTSLLCTFAPSAFHRGYTIRHRGVPRELTSSHCEEVLLRWRAFDGWYLPSSLPTPLRQEVEVRSSLKCD